MTQIFSCLLVILSLNWVSAQDLSYYLPSGLEYDQGIPTPASVLGHEVGEWHASHDKLVHYLKVLAEASPRITLETYGYTYERRPLLLLTITSRQNHQNLEQLRQEHLKLSNPAVSAQSDPEQMPVVVWMGYSVHGNEASGSNASMLAAYHLAAAQGEEIESLLDNAIILIDPSINPDGMNRFASWVNSHRSKNLDPNPESLEHSESWPRGRTNHYWFDLNRDWLPLQHPESQGRIIQFHRWKPNVLTDHHEMRSNRTFFFQPGVHSRNHPLTPTSTIDLTGEIAGFHAKALDEIGSLYYSGEGYDDFYFGKGSTYPDINGGIGILFEQASVRGHLRKTDNGLLSFPFAIRNQFTTTLSTLEAAVNLRVPLLQHQRNFYQSALSEASSYEVKAYLFGGDDRAKLHHFLNTVRRHQINIYALADEVRIEQKRFSAPNSYIIPLDQPQHRLIRALFEQRTSFSDSLFYDVSAWTLPLAYGIEYAELNSRDFQRSLLGDRIDDLKFPEGEITPSQNPYAYAFAWDSYFAPRTLNSILQAGFLAKVATEPMYLPTGDILPAGAILVPVSNQSPFVDSLHSLMQERAAKDGIKVYALETGFGGQQRSWGSPTLATIKLPNILLLTDGDISGYEAGEVWHLLDHRLDIPLTLVAQQKINSYNLTPYNTIVLPDGQYKSINNVGKEKLSDWVKSGGTLIAWKKGAKWLSDAHISQTMFKTPWSDTTSYLAYGYRDKYSGAQVIGGAIFETIGDLTHPLLYGYDQSSIAVFRNHDLFMQRSKNPFTNPLMYTNSPLLSGYISTRKLEELKDTPAVDVSHMGSGKVISFSDNPNFRAFWWGTNKLFLNAIFFGPIIENETLK